MSLTWTQVIEAMKGCEQMPGMSVLEHGYSVCRHYNELELMLHNEKNIQKFPNWKLPKWFLKYRDKISEECYSSSVINFYLTYHDLGKPFCLEIDSEGKRHFPNHAQKSYEIWNQLQQDDPVSFQDWARSSIRYIGDLILHDMDLHTIKSNELDEWYDNYGSMMAMSLLLAALAEIHSNAEMFGGIESTSFKIKWKQIDRRGNQICQKVFGENHVG